MFSITGLIIACLIYHNAHGLSDPQIIGGNDAPDGKYPYQVSLKNTYTKSHFCGGAIISKRYVITAAYCLENIYNPSNILINVGSNHLFSQTKTYKAQDIISHPNYSRSLHRDDIGLIKLTEDIKFDKNVTSIPITTDKGFEGFDLIVTGWGAVSKNGEMPDRLQELTVKGLSQKACAETYRNININITNNHICTARAFGQGVCFGDSGSALTYNGELVGIVSFATRPCAKGFPDVFTRVVHYSPWINKYINAGSNQQLNILPGILMTYLCTYLFL